MGVFTSKKKETSLEGEEVSFDHFQVIRAIGRGSFGKVCIVQKKDSKQMFAMKYMNKAQCKTKDALSNVFREIEILASVSHPFLVNLWFSFQDAEDMFMVVELLLGGDLRYHLQQGVTFGDEAVRLYVLEVASALTYLHARNIIHRDIKPDNLLLDEEGHVHITDFNIAAVVRSGQAATSLSGTKPYMAPEIFECTMDECSGYGPAVDWWSLGVSAYEIRRGKRPFDIHSHTSLVDIRRMFHHLPRLPPEAHPGLAQLILGLLVMDPGKRITSLEEVRQIPYMAFVSMEDVLNKRVKPIFMPPKDHLNCDPTFELEEMIIESRPLHEKKKRLSKQKSLTNSQPGATDAEGEKYGGMLVFNREVEEARREKERKEKEREERERNWQEELEESMRLSDPTGHGCSFTGSQCNTPVKTKSPGGHKQKSGHMVSSSPLTCVIVTSDDPEHVTKTAVSPTSVRARIAGSPKVKVKGSTVTIESPRSSSSSHTKTSTQYLQERLKELQAEQRRPTTDTQSSDVTHSDDVTLNASQSQRSVENRSASRRTGVKNDQSECEEEKSSASRVEGSENRVEKEEEEEEKKKEKEKMVCLHTTTTTTTTSLSNIKNNNNNLSNRSSNKKEEEEEKEEEKVEEEEKKRTREEEEKRR